MEYIPRALTSRFFSLAEHFPVVVVSGARQVGKSTFLQEVLKGKAEFVTFDPVIDVEGARSDPFLFLSNHRRPLVLDEIQYAPEVASAIKRAVDSERKAGSFFISGSQQWAVMKGLSDSLAGRAVFCDLEGFSAAELRRAESWVEEWFSQKALPPIGFRADAGTPLPERLWRGWMPEAQNLPIELISDFYSAYFRTYVERDARSFSAPHDIQAFGSFIRLAAALTAQEINASAMARELGLSMPTVVRWFETLAATFQYYSLPAFSANPGKRVTGKRKGVLGEVGLAVSLLGLAGPSSVADSPLRGRLFETLAIGEIRKAASLMRPSPILQHWRSAGGAEVDLVAEWNGVLYPFEFKLTSNPGRRDASGISAFRSSYPDRAIAPGAIVCACEKPYPITEWCQAVPWDWAD